MTTSEHSTTPIVSEAHVVSEASFDNKIRHSEGIPSNTPPHALKPHNKIGKKKKKSKRRTRLKEVIHFDSDEEDRLDLNWGKFFYAWRLRDD